jgi:hypothetical protein
MTGHAGLTLCRDSTSHRSHSAVCTETEIPKGGIEFSGSAEVQAVGPIRQIRTLEFEKSASNRGRGFPINSDQARGYRIGRRRENFWSNTNFGKYQDRKKGNENGYI